MSVALTPPTRTIAPLLTSPAANAAAAFIGPTVWDEDGPTPDLEEFEDGDHGGLRPEPSRRAGSRDSTPRWS